MTAPPCQAVGRGLLTSGKTFGFRFLARSILIRVDVGGSPEGAAVRMMVEQPFQF